MKEVKDNKKKNVKKEEEKLNIFKDKILLVLIIIVVLLFIVIIVIKISTINHLDTESKLVTELHNYFSDDDLGDCNGLFNYAEDKVEYSDVDEKTRVCVAYQKAEIKNTEKETLDATKKKNTCTKDNMVFRADEETNKCEVTIINKNIIDDSYKKLYGKDIEGNESFKIDNLNICYLKDDKYYCGLSETFTYTLGNESVIYRVINKAVEEGSDIVIYDYFVKINNDTCFKAYTTTTVSENCTEEYKKNNEIDYKFMQEYATQYKHIYKLADDDTYYWVSSEPIKE